MGSVMQYPRNEKQIMKNIAIGDVRVSRIEEMLGPAMAPQAFFREYSDAEFKEHEHWLAPNFYQAETGKLIASNHSWLLHTGRHVVLIDSCSGNHKPRPEMARYDMLNTSDLENLKAAGVQPEEIDFVLCTHLHVDHVGWNTRLENGRWVPTFRNAKHVMSRVEHDFWCAKARDPATQQTLKNVYNDSVLPVVENGMAVMFDNGYSLDDCLTIVPAPGHTPGHVRIDEWPTNAAMLSAEPCRSSMSMYCGKLSKSQRTPARSVSMPIPSTCVRFCITSSRSCGLQGAIVKPQLPMIAVVTPSAGEGVAYGSQVSCAA